MSDPNRFLLNDGNRIPRTAWGCGTAQAGRDVETLTANAVRAGIHHLDGAQSYGNEDSLGTGVVTSGTPRSKLFITTKLTRVPPGRTVRSALLSSLQKLGVGSVDLFLVHSPSHHQNDATYGGQPGAHLRHVWKEMEEVKREGLTKSIGVSNFMKHDLEVILEGATVIPSVNQIEYHANILGATSEVVEFCKEKGIVIEAYGTLSPVFRATGSLVQKAIADIRANDSKWSGVTDGQILIKWAHAKGIVAVTTTTKEDRMREIAATLTDTIPELSEKEVDAIDGAGEGQHQRHFWKKEFA